MASIIDAITSPLRNAGELVQNIVEIRDQIKLGELQVKLQAQIMAALQGATAAQAHELEMGEEIRHLKNHIMKLENWEAEKKRYQLSEMPPGVFVYSLKPDQADGEPMHHLCQPCYQKGQKFILDLSAENNGVRHVKCAGCGSDWRIGYFRAPPIHNRPRDDPWGR